VTFLQLVAMHEAGKAINPSPRAATTNAVSEAIGVRMRKLPITPEKMLQALKQKATAVAGQPSPGEAC